MRTTLTLDDDVAAKLRLEARKTGRSFRDVVNDAIRRGLMERRSMRSAGRFRVIARDMGNLQVGVDLDNIADLLDRVEGPLHR